MAEKDYSKEKEILAQIYNNEAQTIKYLPYFFKTRGEFTDFLRAFAGKTLKIPTSYQEYLEEFMKLNDKPKNRSISGICRVKKMKRKVLDSYLHLFPSLEQAIKNELKE